MKSRVWNFISLLVVLELCVVSVASADLNLVEEPKGCLKTGRFPCAVRIPRESQNLQIAEAQITMSSGTSMVFFGSKQWRLLEGKIWVRSPELITLQAGVVHTSVRGDVWFECVASARVLVRNLDGELIVRDSAKVEGQGLPVGFENWYSLINSEGNVSQGVFKAIEAQRFLFEWADLAKLPKPQAISKIQTYKRNWMGNVEVSSRYYQQIINRRLASIEEEESAKIHKQQALLAEQARMRKMFRERFEDR